MQIIHSFHITPREYFKRGKNNDFPRIDVCPCCSHPSTLPRHGFYWRNALFRRQEFRIPILRLKCNSCEKTISLLPDFLLPCFQYSLKFILGALRRFFLGRKNTTNYQLLQFYRQRFLKNLNRIEVFFRDQGYRGIVPEKQRAIKLLELIDAFPKAGAFAKRFQDHFLRSFMAN